MRMLCTCVSCRVALQARLPLPMGGAYQGTHHAMHYAPPYAVSHAMYATLKERLASHASPHGVTEAETTPTEWRERRRFAEMPSAAAPERSDVDRSTWEWEGRRVNRRLRPGLTAAPQSPSGP